MVEKKSYDYTALDIRGYVEPKPILGEVDADTEWAQESEAANLFLRTESYETFTQPNFIFLFGRRGTGKTAMMRMLKYEVTNGHNSYYSYAHLLSQEDAYHQLATHLRMSPLSTLPQPELVYQLTNKWRWVIMLSAMTAVVKAHKDTKVAEQDPDIAVIKKYLTHSIPDTVKTITAESETSPLSSVLAVVTDELDAVDYSPTRVGSALIKITRRLFSPDYEQACQALSRIIKKSHKACVVMVDSIELYNLRDSVAQAVTTALMDAAYRMYGSSQNNGVVVKVAFPSEVYPYLNSINREKTEGKNLFILWRYRDLVTLLAKRYWQLVDKQTSIEQCKALNNYHEARAYLYTHLPPTVGTETEIDFDTLAFIIRHTQKKPRQVILLLNVILTLAKTLGKDNASISEEIVKRGTRARLDLLVKGTLDIYSTICSEVEPLVMRALADTPSEFDYSRLDQQMKEIHSLRKSIDIGAEEVKHLFLETGVLGMRRARRNFHSRNKVISIGLFEYQVKRRLYLTNKSVCVVHPMFYQDLRTDIDKDTFIYPMPVEDEEKELLEEAGIVLGAPTAT
ncbi:MAG: P-loop ATPase, Sll1717 family [Phycisphaerae bacterium]